MESGWDVKHMLTLMVSSHAYRQSSKVATDLQERDPDNRLLARGPRFRPTGAILRDQVLAVSGLLSPKCTAPAFVRLAQLETSASAQPLDGRSDWTLGQHGRGQVSPAASTPRSAQPP